MQQTFINIFSLFFYEKIRHNVSSESSARQRIHMKNQALFSSKDKSKKLKCCLLQFLFGALRVKHIMVPYLLGCLRLAGFIHFIPYQNTDKTL